MYKEKSIHRRNTDLRKTQPKKSPKKDFKVKRGANEGITNITRKHTYIQ